MASGAARSKSSGDEIQFVTPTPYNAPVAAAA
jgi:hypothetical protein